MNMDKAGLLAVFTSAKDLEAATELIAKSGFTAFDPLSPFAISALFPPPENCGSLEARFPWLNLIGALALAAGLTGIAGGFGMQWLANSWAQPMNAGGRPLFSWPAYVPITFVLGILFAALAVFFSLILLLRLPEPYHPTFHSPSFNLSEERFYLFLSRDDPRFDKNQIIALLQCIPAMRLEEIKA